VCVCMRAVRALARRPNAGFEKEHKKY